MRGPLFVPYSVHKTYIPISDVTLMHYERQRIGCKS